MGQQLDSPFDGIDALEGAEIMELVGLSVDDLKFPDKYQKFQDIASYLTGKVDKSFIVHKISAGKNVNMLDHVWSYITLRKQHEAKSAELKKLEEEIGFYE